MFYLLASIERLEYCGQFYPALQVKRLYTLLTSPTPLCLANPALQPAPALTVTPPQPQQDSSRRNSEEDAPDTYRDHMRGQRQKKKSENVLKDGEMKIDLTSKVASWDDARKKLILEFFISHFIKIAKKSRGFRDYGQAVQVKIS